MTMESKSLMSGFKIIMSHVSHFMLPPTQIKLKVNEYLPPIARANLAMLSATFLHFANSSWLGMSSNHNLVSTKVVKGTDSCRRSKLER